MKLVSAICPTRNRREFLPGAITDFLAQDYRAKELVIVDDEDAADCSDLIPKHRKVRYARIKPGHSLGEKRNIACDLADGEILLHWDDDDAYLPRRISEQVEVIEAGADVTGYRDLLFFDQYSKRLWAYTGSRNYAVGVSLCYRRTFWENRRWSRERADGTRVEGSGFIDDQVGEDNEFIRGLEPPQLVVRTGNQIIARIHDRCTCRKSEEVQMRNQQYWREIA